MHREGVMAVERLVRGLGRWRVRKQDFTTEDVRRATENHGGWGIVEGPVCGQDGCGAAREALSAMVLPVRGWRGPRAPWCFVALRTASVVKKRRGREVRRRVGGTACVRSRENPMYLSGPCGTR